MNFVIIGFGYIAIRHLEAIKMIKGNVVAVYDPHNSAGILDRYFPKAKFFNLFEEFDNFCQHHQPDFVCVLSPNHLHRVHISWAVSNRLPCICEKPIAISKDDITNYIGLPVYPILQLRYHPNTTRLKIMKFINPKIEIEYCSPRGDWYKKSWKADERLSGGLLFNIGIHLFDLILHIFGPVESIINAYHSENTETGEIKLFNGSVSYKLSIAPGEAKRLFIVNGEKYEFDSFFENLHNACYWKIVQGKAIPIEDCFQSIYLIESIKLWKKI